MYSYVCISYILVAVYLGIVVSKISVFPLHVPLLLKRPQKDEV